MKLHFALRYFNLNFYLDTVDRYTAVFPIRAIFESDSEWNDVQDCIGFLYDPPEHNDPFWVLYKLKKI